MDPFQIESLQNSKLNIFIIFFFMLIIFILLFIGIKMNDNYLQENVLNISEKNKNEDDKHDDKHENKHDDKHEDKHDDKHEDKHEDKHDDKHDDKPEGQKEVYNISENIYTYNDAPYVCKIFGGELATLENLKEEYKKGADWCNYGWSEGQNAYYPTQPNSWKKLQESDNHKDMCGNPGINGGYFANPDLKFGVNCYGVKPKKTSDNSTSISQSTHKTPEELEAEKKILELESQKKDIQILPFSKHEWSLNKETNSNSFIKNNSSDY